MAPTSFNGNCHDLVEKASRMEEYRCKKRVVSIAIAGICESLQHFALVDGAAYNICIAVESIIAQREKSQLSLHLLPFVPDPTYTIIRLQNVLLLCFIWVRFVNVKGNNKKKGKIYHAICRY